MLISYVTKSNAVPFPNPVEVVKAIERSGWRFLHATALTSARVAIGLVIGGMLSYSVFYLGYLSKSFLSVFSAMIEIVRPIPPIALTPFFIIWFGIGNFSQILMIVLGSFMVIFVGMVESVDNLETEMMDASSLLTKNKSYEFWKLVVPKSLPSMLGPYRIAAGTAFALTVAAEFLGAQGGLGYIIRNARTILQIDIILAAAITLGIVAAGFDALIRYFVKYLTPWNRRN